MKQTLLALVVVAVCLVAPALMKADTNANVGTWKLNVEKSKYPAGMTPKSLTRTVAVDGDKVKYNFEGTAADGSALSYSFTVKYDGQDNEITGTGPFGADHISIKQLNSHMFEAILKKGDKVIGTSHSTVSHDGKTTTITGKGTDKDGKPIKQTQVYDKQ